MEEENVEQKEELIILREEKVELERQKLYLTTSKDIVLDGFKKEKRENA